MATYKTNLSSIFTLNKRKLKLNLNTEKLSSRCMRSTASEPTKRRVMIDWYGVWLTLTRKLKLRTAKCQLLLGLAGIYRHQSDFHLYAVPFMRRTYCTNFSILQSSWLCENKDRFTVNNKHYCEAPRNTPIQTLPFVPRDSQWCYCFKLNFNISILGY